MSPSHQIDNLSEEKFRELVLEVKREGRVGFFVDTASMAPLIRPETVVEIVPLDRELKSFDIIAFRAGRKLVCHLVLHCNMIPDPKGEKTVTTCALNATRDPIPVRVSDIIGLVSSHRIPRATRIKFILGQVWRRLLNRS